MVILEASAVSSIVPALTLAAPSGCVHSVFRRVMNISWGGGLIAVADERLDELPNGVMVAIRQPCGFQDLPVEQGAGVTGVSQWVVGSDVIIDMSRAKVFPARRSIEPPLLSTAERSERLEQARQVGALLAPVEGLAPLWAQAGQMLSGAINPDLYTPHLLRTAYVNMTDLVAGTRAQDWNQARAAAGCLLGLGIGLTPSGDDLLTGFMASQVLVYSALGQEQRALPLIAAVLDQAGGKTNAIAFNYLHQAARGEVTAALARYIACLAAWSADPVEHATSTLFSFGATSGAELGLGAFLGVSAIR